MNKKVFNFMGWMILIGLFLLWIFNGYSDWNIVLLPVAYICFAIAGGSIKKLKWLSGAQIIEVVLSFVLSVVAVLALVYVALYVINDVLQLEGMMKSIVQWGAVILILLPVMFVFGSVINRIDDSLKEKYKASLTGLPVNRALHLEAVELLKSHTKIQTIKAIRKRHHLSLVEAKEVVDAAEDEP